MGGTFHSRGRGYAWKRDEVAEPQRAQNVSLVYRVLF
jgi:hypothetical protein